MEVDRVEGELAGEPQGHHDHPRHPEEKDVMTCLQQGGGEEGLEVLVVLSVGPSEDREREEAGREPGVQHVLILLNLNLLAKRFLRLGRRLCGRATGEPPVFGLLRLDYLVRGNPVSPPQLPRDAPLLNVFQPVVPSLVVELGEDLQLAFPQGFDAPVCQIFAVHPPLRLQVGLNDVLGSGAEAQPHFVRLLSDPQALLLQRLFHGAAGFKAMLALEVATVLVDLAVLCEHVDLLQAVPDTSLEVIVVVCRRDFHAASPKLLVHHGVCNYHHFPVWEERVFKLLPVEGLVPLILRVNSHGGVTKHGLQTRGGHDQSILRSLDGILELAKNTHLNLVLQTRYVHQGLPLDLLMVHLEI
mmetsp:Transcript_15329/g.28931  ORF Transcript_15329/g.28931 Transcript_15329/m.28931 type:complete len:357 (-) Transcript_15329:484-1554(-)